MRKLPFAILACVVLFLAVVLGVLLHRSRSTRLAIQAPIESTADSRIKEVHLQEQTRGGSRWQLDAEIAESFQQQGRTVMRKVVVQVQQPGRTWTVTGDEGDLVDESKDVELRGNVVLTSSDGLRLETQRLRWTAAEQRAWTDDPVVIYRSGTIVRGTGFQSRVEQETTEVKGRVRATFTKGKPAGAEAAGEKKS
ncbi:MAG TPA: LPS export ABC transporter periplasmic protein LptC [Methylomirabilota bacterium]|nr:LPS export ABC transporter periplasmic protein LptC [Methylomirabilota bacterium]